MPKIILTGSVGHGGDNNAEDVETVRTRLRDLGYSWIGATGGGNAAPFVRVIRLFQAICAGDTKFVEKDHDGLVSAKGNTHKWLAATNAPKWVQVLGQSGPGWQSTTMPGGLGESLAGGTAYTLSNGGWGTSWIVDMLNAAGREYQRRIAETILSHDYGGATPPFITGDWVDHGEPHLPNFARPLIGPPSTWKTPLPPMWVRDCARAHAGGTGGHKSHQTGLDIDMRLPQKDWRFAASAIFVPWKFLNSPRLRRKHFNRVAAEHQLSALVALDQVTIIGFEDDTAPRGMRKLNRRFAKVRGLPGWPNHEHHYHVRIKPPKRIDGQVA